MKSIKKYLKPMAIITILGLSSQIFVMGPRQVNPYLDQDRQDRLASHIKHVEEQLDPKYIQHRMLMKWSSQEDNEARINKLRRMLRASKELYYGNRPATIEDMQAAYGGK